MFPAARRVGVAIDPTDVRLARAAVLPAPLCDPLSSVEAGADDTISAGSFAAVVMVEVRHEIHRARRTGVAPACYRALTPGSWRVSIAATYPEPRLNCARRGASSRCTARLKHATGGRLAPPRVRRRRYLPRRALARPCAR